MDPTQPTPKKVVWKIGQGLMEKNANLQDLEKRSHMYLYMYVGMTGGVTISLRENRADYHSFDKEYYPFSKLHIFADNFPAFVVQEDINVNPFHNRTSA